MPRFSNGKKKKVAAGCEWDPAVSWGDVEGGHSRIVIPGAWLAAVTRQGARVSVGHSWVRPWSSNLQMLAARQYLRLYSTVTASSGPTGPKVPLFINGEFVQSAAKEFYPVRNPVRR